MGADSILRDPRADRSSPRRHRTGDSLYGWAAAAAALIIFAGFARTFYLRSVFATPPLSPLLMVHGIVMTAWLLLFIVQVRLVAVSRLGLHRRLGLAGIVVATLVLATGVATAIDAARRGVSPGPGFTPLMFMAVPLFDLPVFALLAGLGLWNRRRPDIHKRLMLLATVSLLTPGIARIPLDFIQHGGPPVFFALALSVPAACIAIDTARHRRLHPAFLWGGVLIVTMLPLRLFVAGTAAWSAFARWLVA